MPESVLSFNFYFPHPQGLGPYSAPIKRVEKDIKDMAKKINDLCGALQDAEFPGALKIQAIHFFARLLRTG